jgi:DNA-binding XRE family transcriptional regulator
VTAMATYGYQRLSDSDVWAVTGSSAIAMHIETDMRRPSKLHERAVGAVLLYKLREGDTLVAGTLSDLCDLPSDAVRLTRVLAGRGVKLRILEEGSLEAAASAFTYLEGELAHVRTELSKIQAIADARVEHARREILSMTISKYGAPPSWSDGMPTGAGDVTKPLGATLGDALRKRREAMALSQAQAAEQSGVTQSTISRAERDQLPAPERLLTFLFDAAEITQGEHA